MSPAGERGTGRRRARRTLVVTGLTKEFDEVPALDDVSFEVGPGERVVLIGLNGSGKTTLLRTLAGLSESTSGDVTVDGHHPGTVEARAAVSFIPDEPVLYDDLSLLEHLEYIGRMHGNEAWEAEGDELVERLGLAGRAENLPSTFSRGLRQKSSIALGLVRSFSLLLVDEPFVGLDRPGRETLLELLAEAAVAGAALIVATHQDDYLGMATRCIALHDGVVVYDGPATPEAVDEVLGT